MATGPQNKYSRRDFHLVGLAAAAIGVIAGNAEAAPAPTVGKSPAAGLTGSNTLTTAGGTQIYFKDWGAGQPAVFSHGWPLNSDAFEDQMFYLASKGFSHSTGGGEVGRYIGRHGTQRVAKAVLISAISPTLLKTAVNPDGIPIEVFDKLRTSVHADRTQFWNDLGFTSPDAARRNLPDTIRYSPEAGARSWASMLALFSTTLAERTGVAERVAA